MNLPGNIHIIGCGGVTGYLLPSLTRWIGERIFYHLWDGDKVEEHNLKRQFFLPRDIEKYKAPVMLQLIPRYYRKKAYKEYAKPANFDPDIGIDDLIIACVDNNQTRQFLLKFAYLKEVPILIAANEAERFSANFFHPEYTGINPRKPAYFLNREWQDEDPKDYFSCASEPSPEWQQSAFSNQGAAFCAQALLHYWYIRKRNPHAMIENFPVHIRSTIKGKTESITLEQYTHLLKAHEQRNTI